MNENDTQPIEAGTGPYLQFACFCDHVLQEQDGTLSLIRIIDTVTQTARGVDVPDQMPPFVVAEKLVISLKAGKARGRYAIKIRPEDPSGTHLPTAETAIHLQSGMSGINIITDMQFAAQHEGLYWFDIIFARAKGEGDVLLTRIPLSVVYRPERLMSPPDA